MEIRHKRIDGESKIRKKIRTIEDVKEYIKENSNVVLLTDTYKNSTSPITLLCTCGEEYETTFELFKKSKYKLCKICSGVEKWNIKRIKTYVEENSDSKLLSKEYIAGKNIKLLCKCGNSYETLIETFEHGGKRHCDECGKKNYRDKRSFTIEYVKQVIEVESNSGCKLLSQTYTTNEKPLKLLCKCNREFHVSYANFISGKHQCNICSGVGIWDYETFKDFVTKESTSVLLSTNITNTLEKLAFKCKCGNKYKTTIGNFIYNNKRQCNPCGKEELVKQMRLPIERVKEIIEVESQSGCKLVSENYYSNKKPLTIRCKCSNLYNVTIYNFIKGQRRCKECSNRMSSGERKVKEYLDYKEILYKQEYTVDGLIGVGGGHLRFDFAILDNNQNVIKIIEVDGAQHDKPLEFFGGEAQFNKTLKHDEIKNTYCKDNNIPLLRIPHWEIDDIDDILESELYGIY